ncbi:signal peptidase I [Paraglaciecola psychrophila]|uniref:Signal peptidase I n=1 Tax=Paraglaciecola psychrophila 170 TaxID=1129794 RepID=K7AT55_9ALTE|nr:signal peptidase I [Paraglaciecola psychrophila]AGH43335.1 signal peptidase I [Paraglaciecola psychrophila 170]GAC38410.1 signal peptidase I [Paraglaciecola psychrophila 170]
MNIKILFNKLVKENWGILLFTLVLFASRSSFADWYVVPTGSMLPTIVEGDRIFVDKMAYRLELPFTDIEIMQTGQPKRGDIVVFNSEKADNRLVKRLIGEPDDKVAMLDNKLSINGEQVLYEDSDNELHKTEYLGDVAHFVQFMPVAKARDNFSEVIVPQGHYLVLGDTRNKSADSRYYGFVPAIEIQGKANNVLVSLDPENYYLPRKERFNAPLI